MNTIALPFYVYPGSSNIYDTHHRAIGAVWTNHAPESNEEIAQHIVHAVNCHDALVEALRLVSVELYWLNLPEGASAKVFEALAMARGETS